MVFFSMSSETPHCKGNESQDIVSLLETVMMSTERETQIQEAKGFMKSTGLDQELMRCMDEVKMR
jgi:hypothetical protein